MVGTILRPALLASTALVGIGVRRLDVPSVLHVATSPGILRAHLTRLLALAVEPAVSLLARLGGGLVKRARRAGPVARLQRRRWRIAALAGVGALTVLGPLAAIPAAAGGGAGGGATGGTGGADSTTATTTSAGNPGNPGASAGAGGGGGGAGVAGGGGGTGNGGAAGGSGGSANTRSGGGGGSSATVTGGGGGGGGGASAYYTPAGTYSLNVGTFTGANGGNGGAGNGTGSGGGGGAGGSEEIFAAGTTINFGATTTVRGGTGGAGGAAGGSAGSFGGNGGDGGAGWLFGTGSTVRFLGNGSLIGGNGGAGGGNGGGGTAGQQGAGGAGVVGASLTIDMTAGGILASGTGSTPGNAATFVSGTNVLTLGATATGATLTGNLEVRAGTLQINAAAGGSTLANLITGAGGLIQNSANTLTLTGANTYSGGTTVSAGQLALSGAGTLGDTGNALTVSGGTLELGGTTQTQNGGLTLTGGTIQDGTLSSTGTFGLQAGTVSAVLAGTGAVSKTGAGTVTLSGANTYSGGTTVSAGQLTLSGAGTLGDTGNALTVSGGTLELGGTTQTQNGGLTLTGGTIQDGTLSSTGTFGLQAGTVSAVLAGTGAASKTGAGTVTLSGANTYSGGTTISAGILNVRTGSTITGGVITSGGLGTGTVTNTATLQLQNGITLANALNLGGTLQSLSDNDTYNGPITLTANSVIQSDTGLMTVGGTIDGAHGLTLQGAGNGTTTGLIGGGTALTTLTMAGTGTWTLSGTTNSFTGAVSVDTGTLVLSTGSTLTSTGVTVANGASFTTTGTVASAVTNAGTVNASGVINGAVTNTNAFTLTGALTGITSLSNDGTFTLGGNGLSVGALTSTGTAGIVQNASATAATLTVNQAGNTTYAGILQDGTGGGALSLTKSGAGTLSLSGANTYTGATTISGGTLALTGNGAIADSNGVIDNATFDISGTNAGASITTLSGSGGTTLGGQTLTITAGSTTYAGVMSGTGGLTVSGGTQTLTGANTYTGQTTVSAGTLQVGAGGNTGQLGQNGATYSNVAVSNGAVLTVSRANTYAYGGVVSGAGTLNQNGGGLLNLTGTNSTANGQFTGTANVNAGILAVNGTFGDTAGSAATVNVNNGGTLHGTGRIYGTVIVNSGGTVSAGNSPGTTTYTNYTLNTGSNTVFELNQPNVTGGANNDLIQVSNTLTVNSDMNGGAGLTLQTTAGATPTAGVYRIFTYGTLAGMVSNFTTTVAGGGTANVYALNNGINVRVFGAGQILQYWDGTDTTGATAGAQGGTATWNATNFNWVDDPTNGTANDTWRMQAGVFGNGTTNNAAAGGTVTVDGAQDFQSLRFSDNNYTLVAGTAGTLNLVGNSFAAAADQAYSAVTVDPGNTAVLNLPITSTGGSFGLLKLGTGTLNLGGASTYTGGTRIDAGTLAILAGGSVASLVTNNATFTNAGTVNAGVTNSATGTATNTNLITGLVTNSGGFTNSGGVSGGLNNLAGTYTQNGGATNGGTTNAATINANGGSFGGPIANTTGGAFTVGGAVTADSTFTNAGNATLSVTAGSLTGITILTQNSTGAVLTALGTSLSAGGLAGTTAGATIANAGTLTLVGGVGDTSYAGTITGAGAFTKSGSGVQTLSGSNGAGAQYTGAAAVNGGTLQITGVFGDTAANAATLSVGTGGTLVGSGAFAGSVTNSGTLATGAAPGIGQVGAMTVRGNLTIQLGSINAFDLGTPNVVGGATNDLLSVGGSLTVNGGTLALTNAPASGLYRLYTVTGAITTAGAANAGFTTVTASSGTATVYTVPVAGTPGPSQLNVRISNGGQLVQYWDGMDMTGVPGGTAGAQGGTGTWNASNTNWTDDPVAGQINQNWQSQFGVFLAPGGTVTVQGTQNAQGLQFSSNGYTLVPDAGGGAINLTYDPGAGVANFGTIRVDGGVSTTIAAPITGLGLNKIAGAGTLVLTGTNSFSALNIGDGTLEVRNGAAIADAAPVSLANVAGARLLVTNSETIGSLSGGGGSGGRVEIAAGQTLTTGFSNASTTFAGTIADVTTNGALTKTGTGTFTLTGTNTFTGQTRISAGLLEVQNGQAIADQSAVVIDNVSGARLLVTNSETIGSLAGGGTTGGSVGIAANQTLTTGANNASTTFAGTIDGAGALTKTGSGSFTLTAANSYAGGTTVSQGTLINTGSLASQVTNSATFNNLGTVNAAVTNNATGTASNSGSIAGLVSNSGGFTNTGLVSGGLSNLAGSYTQNGGATNGGTTNAATIAANAGSFGGPIANTTGGAFTVGGAVTADSTFTNAGNATLSVTAGSLTGITILTQNSTGAVTTALGTSLSAGGLAGTTAGATIANAGTLTLVGGVGDTSYAGTLTGAGPFTKSGSGVQTLSGRNGAGAQYTGAAAVNGGTLQITGVFGDTAANAATLSIGAAGTLVGTGTFAGSVTNNGFVAAGATAATGSVGTLTIGGNYTIAAGSTNAFDLGTPNIVGGATNDLVVVGGNLTIAGGTLALTNATASGLYRLYNVGGSVTSALAPNAGFTTVTASNGTATVFTVPVAGTPGPSQLNVRFSNGGQLVQYWDGMDMTGATPGAQGGTGVWSANNTNWTEDPAVGQINEPWQGQFGVFLAPGGTVTVQGQQNLQGLQFSGNGYTLIAGAAGSLNLTGDPSLTPTFSTIRIDGGVTTTIAAPITGLGLNKVVGAGTLVLTGTNSFNALTIADGTVEVRNGAAIADTAPVTIANVAGARLLVTNSETIGSLSGGGGSGGSVGIAAGQTLTTGVNNASTTFAGTIDGAGALTKTGSGSFTLTGSNSYAGGTSVAQGTLINNGSLASQVTNNAGASFVNNGAVNAGHTNNGTSTNNGSIAGNVGNGGSFTNNGSVGGRLTNTNAATNTGTINGGVTNSGSFGNSAGATINAGLINNAGTTTNAGTINGGATVNGGTLTTRGTINGGLVNAGQVNAQGTINGNVSNSGGFTVTGRLTDYGNGGAAGIVRLTNTGSFDLGGLDLTIGSLAGTLASATIGNGGTLTTGGDGTSTAYLGRIIGASTALTKVGGGTFTLSGNNSYGGLTTIQAGTLAVSATGLINGSSQILNSAGFTIAAGGQVSTQRLTNNAGGTVSSAGTLTASTAITNAGVFTVSGGTVNTPSLSNTATLSQTGGTLNATAFDNAASGSFNQTAGTLNTATTTNAGSFSSAGTVNAGTAFANAGVFTVSGGTVNTASLSNTRTLSQTGGTINATAFDNAAGGLYLQTAAGILNAATITNAGGFGAAGPVNATTSFTNRASGLLMATGTVTTPTFVNAGRVVGLLTLAGVSQITNQGGALIQDGLSVSAAAGGARLDNAGTIGTGALVINTAAGTLNAFNTSDHTFFGYVSSSAGTTSTFTNTATGVWAYQGIGNLDGTDTIVNQGLFVVTSAGGTLNGLERFDNQAGGTVVLNASLGGPITVFDNAGTLGIPAAGGFNGSLGALAFNNLASGTVSLQNGQVTDRLTLGGTYAGTAGSRIAIDVDLSRADAGTRGDVLAVTGTDSGSSLLNVNVVSSGRVFFSTPIPVVQAGGGTLQLQIDPARPLPTTGFISYSLEGTPGAPGSYQIVSRINPGAAAASASGISGLITSINVGFFQSISAFLSGPAQHRLCTEELRNARLCDQPASGGGVGVTSSGRSWEQTNQQAAAAPVAAGANASGILPDTYGLGLWARGSGGESTIRSGSTADFGGGATLSGQNKTRVGYAGMQFGGDFAVFNIANSGFNLHMGVTGGEVYANGKELLSSQATGAFNVPFVGFYAAVTSGAFTSDLLYRHDFYDARVNDPDSGVMNRRLAIGSDTVGGSMGYRIDLPRLFGTDQAYFIEPSGQMSHTETRIGVLPVTGGALSFRPIESVLGRVGFRAGTNVKLGEVLALQPFVTAAVWNEFADKAASRFTAQTIVSDPNAFVPILTNRVGTFGQAGVGIAGQLLGTDLLGYVRADFRFGDRIEGYSVNGGVRYPF